MSPDAPWLYRAVFHDLNSASEGFGRSRGGLTTKIHAVVDANRLPLNIVISGGQQHDSFAARALLDGLPGGGAAEWFSPTKPTT